MYGLEQKVFQQLVELKKKYKISGIKAEFEAEGSSFRDLVRLRRISAYAGIKLFLKIGGVEAVRDIKDALEIGVDGLIAPMVESKFGVKKYYQAYKRIYKNHRINLTINIETKNAAAQIDDIINYAKDKINNITLGRTDLTDSYFNNNLSPDSKNILNLIGDIGRKASKAGLGFTVGGSLSVSSINIFNKNLDYVRYVSQFETRKVIMPRNMVLKDINSIREALKFEELYILSKKEFGDLFMESEIVRLTKLTGRF